MNHTQDDVAILAEISDLMVRKPISTERVVLRPFRRSDLIDYYAYASQKEQQRLSGNCPCESLRDAEEVMDFMMDPSHPPYAFAIEWKGEQKVIGNLSISRSFPEEGDEALRAQRWIGLSYVLNEDYWNRGIMTEILEDLYVLLFEVVKLDFICSGYFLYNGASGRLHEKLGMRPWIEGIWEWNGEKIATREMIIRREEWLKKGNK